MCDDDDIHLRRKAKYSQKFPFTTRTKTVVKIKKLRGREKFNNKNKACLIHSSKCKWALFLADVYRGFAGNLLNFPFSHHLQTLHPNDIVEFTKL